MDIAKLLLYAQKYYGTKTKGEEYRQKQIAKWVAEVIEQHRLLEELLVDDRFSEIGQFVKFEIQDPFRPQPDSRVEKALVDYDEGRALDNL